jgi:hypothetical protein
MICKVHSSALAALMCAGVAAGLAGAATAGISASPDPSALVLVAGDVPNSIVAFNGALPIAGTSAYASILVPNSSSASSVYESVVTLAADAATAGGTINGIAVYARTKAGRQVLGNAFAKSATSIASSPSLRKRLHVRGSVKISKLVVGAPSTPSASVVVLPISATVSGVKLRLQVAYVQVDRAVNAVEILRTSGPAASSTLARLIAAAQTRMRLAFTVASTSAPSVAGTAAAGQTLTADYGAWTGGATSFAYSWERCAADGTGCAPISGASAASYTVTAADSGSTLRVAVTGSNSVSNATASSTQTAAIG